MKINKLQLQAGASSLVLPILGAQPTDQYVLKDAEGLGPPDIDVYIDNTLIGGYYQGRRTQLRQIVLTVGLNPNYGSNMSAADLRSALYWALSTQSDNPALTFSLMLDAVVVGQCTAYAKSFQINPFSKDPQVIITLESSDRYFKAPVALTALPANIGGAYPYSINNPGSANSGFHFKYSITAPGNPFVITNQQTGKRMQLDLGVNTIDTLDFVTVAGSRGIIWTHTNPAPNPSSTVNVLDNLNASSAWLSLVPGQNNFSISVPGTFTAFDFIPQYWGI